MILKSALIALPVLIALDLIWLGVIAKGFYFRELAGLLAPNVNWFAAALFYVIFVIGLAVFVIVPALQKGEWMHAVLFGALFGFVAYATYDLTNQATLKDWPLIVTVVDMIWGAVIGAAVSVAAYFISSYL